MTLTIVDEMQLERIPRGSGIIKSGEVYYVVGDDSPFLYSLNHLIDSLIRFSSNYYSGL